MLTGIPISQCPTCFSKPDTYGERLNGLYRFDGAEQECDCDEQIMLRKHYMLANIPDQYMRLTWERDFTGSKEADEAVHYFLEKWQGFKVNGMGMEFGGEALGVGKTFAATTVGKGLVKEGERVYFTPFTDVINSVSTGDQEYINELRDVTVLILDEVIPPFSEKSARLFSSRFEDIIRHRTNYNRVTVMTTNMKEEDLREQYARTYSLLSAKQMRIEMQGEDARQTSISKQNLDLILNDEVRPIS